MDYLQFVASMTSSLAWPLVVLCVVCVFRRAIVRMIPLLSEVELPGFSAKFGRELQLVEAGVDEALATTIEPGSGTLTITGHAPTVTQGEGVGPAVRGGIDVSEEPDTCSAEATVAEQAPDRMALLVNPTGVVMESWKTLESACRALATAVVPDNVKLSRRLSFNSLFKLLRANGIVSEIEFETIRRMYEMRNMVAHTDQKISGEDAFRFQEAAEAMADTLLSKLKTRQKDFAL